MKGIKRILLMATLWTLFCTNHTLAQHTRSDSIELRHIRKNIESLEKYQSEWLNNTTTFEELTSRFCFLNSLDEYQANKLFNMTISRSFLEKTVKHDFFVNNVTCFNSEQKRKIKAQLNTELNPTDFFYYELVSKFNLTSQISYLNEHTSDSLFATIKRDIQNGKIAEENKTQLKNYSTLINLGHFDKEDWFISEINDLYSDLSSKNKTNIFYTDILRNSIRLLNSKKAIVNTIYLLDVESTTPLDNQDDITGFSPPLNYFLSCIQPKINDSELEIMAWQDFEVNKEKIKHRVLNDNSIWKKHIKVEKK